MPAVAARRDQGDAALAFAGLGDDALVHLGIRFTQLGQFFFDRFDALGLEAQVFPSRPVDAGPFPLVVTSRLLN